MSFRWIQRKRGCCARGNPPKKVPCCARGNPPKKVTPVKQAQPVSKKVEMMNQTESTATIAEDMSHEALTPSSGSSSSGQQVPSFLTNPVPGSLRRPKFTFMKSDFASIKNSDHFVDKTKFLEVLFADTECVLITAPRRFGKSVNLNMVDEFVGIKVYTKGDGKAGLKVGDVRNRTEEEDMLFRDKNLYIYQCHCGNGAVGIHDTGSPKCDTTRLFEDHYGKYPVIHLDMKDIQGDSYQAILLAFRAAIAMTFERHDYLFKCDDFWKCAFGARKKQRFENYCFPPDDKSEEVMKRDIVQALPFLATLLEDKFERKPYLLIDEYDSCINCACVEKDIDPRKVNKLLDSFFKMLLKGRDCHVERAVLTGISYFASVGLSGANNIKKYLFMMGTDGNVTNERYAGFYGLTVPEVEKLVEKFQSEFWGDEILTIEDVKECYNGYQSLGENKIKIHTIWSVLHALKGKKLGDYWEKSGIMVGMSEALMEPSVAYGIEKLIQMGNESTLEYEIATKPELKDITTLKHLLQKRVEHMQDAETGHTDEKEQVFWKQENVDVFFSFLVQQGYLACSEAKGDGKFVIKIPNDVIKSELKKQIAKHYTADVDTRMGIVANRFNKLSDQSCNIAEILESMIPDLKSIFAALARKWDHTNEAAYQNALFFVLCKTKYMICLEVQGKGGRLDLAFRLDNFVIIIEVKYGKEDAVAATDDALKQIKTRGYQYFIQKKHPDRKLVFTFMGLHIAKDTHEVTMAYRKALEEKITYVTSPLSLYHKQI